MRRLVVIIALLGCAPAATVSSPPAPPVATAAPSPVAIAAPSLPRELHWVRTAAEHDALFIQVFRAARERVAEQARGRVAGTWAIIADADETLLDNSEYQRRRAPFGGTFDSTSWRAWVMERAAPALPGALDYVNAVRALGGRVISVTNRDGEVCDATRENLGSAGLAVDLVLCRTRTSDKNPRFESVPAGTATTDLPPLEVLQWIGDNIQDFPGLTQRVREAGTAALALFGDRYFVLPNPMYGSFERNPPR